MKNWRSPILCAIAILVFSGAMAHRATAQDRINILAGAELTRVAPTSFYFQGLAAPTQMRNAAAARMGTRHVIAGLVDTTGYAADIRARYEGFFITDSPISVGGSDLDVGAYGFGFSNDGKLSILDLAGKEILSVSTTRDNKVRRPRPLMMVLSGNKVRLYSGKDYAELSFR
jgi:hypothetical protein